MSTARSYRKSAAAPSQKTALVNVRVFDGHKVADPTTVLIDGDKIGASCNAAGAQVVDGEGGVLIPGLIDSHCHIDSEAKLKTLTTYGITTALDMLCWPISTMHDMKALAGRDGYPDYLSAGLAATSRSSLPYSEGLVESVAETTQWVADRVHEGSDYIKMIADYPMGEPEVEELAAVAAAARDLGKFSIAHAVTLKGQQRSQAAKVDFITHVPLDEALDEAFVQTMVAENRCAIPTLIMMKLTAEGKGHSSRKPGTEGKKDFPLPSKSVKRDYSLASKSVKLMHDAGVPILAGDDHNTAWFTPAHPEVGNSMHEELKLLVDAGLSPTEALRAATVTPAQKFKLWDRGIVMPDSRADLVLLREDPTVDIANIGTIKQVWCAGVSWTPKQSLLERSSYFDYGWTAASRDYVKNMIGYWIERILRLGRRMYGGGGL